MEKIEKTENEWRDALTPEEYEIIRKRGTERPFSGAYWETHADGRYLCRACGLELFSSDAKFDSGTGWPSFTEPANQENVTRAPEVHTGMRRTEISCARCGAHLGHLFDDGPKERGGKRFCINSTSLAFEAEKRRKASG